MNDFVRIFHFLFSVCLLAGSSVCVRAQTIDLRLDLTFNNPADDQSGGTFRLAALSSGGGGIAGLVTRIDSDPPVLTTDPPPFPYSGSLNSPETFGWMNPIPHDPEPVPPIFNRGYEISPGVFAEVVEIDLLQDNSLPAGSLVYNIGHGAGTPGEQGTDPFGMGFNNAALFVTGTFDPGFIPKFSTVPGLPTEGNVFASAGNSAVIAATVTTTVRDNLGAILAGDYSANGKVDAADYTVWRDKLGTGQILPNDPIGGTIGPLQYNQWKTNFGSMAGSGSMGVTAIPEPASWLIIALLFPTASGITRRSRVPR